jgi:hypothetical protein
MKLSHHEGLHAFCRLCCVYADFRRRSGKKDEYMGWFDVILAAYWGCIRAPVAVLTRTCVMAAGHVVHFVQVL